MQGKTAAAKTNSQAEKRKNLQLNKGRKGWEEIKTPALEKTGSFLLNVSNNPDVHLRP